MASIITATTSSGLTQSADNSGVLQLASGTGNLVTVPSVTGTAMVSGNMPAFSAYQGTLQTLTSGVSTKITFDTEEFDTNNNFASSRFTPTVAGYYTVTAFVQVLPTLEALPSIYKNGSEYKRFTYNTAPSTNYQWGGTVSSIYMNGSTDYLEFYMAQVSAASASKNTTAGQALTYFNGCMTRAA